MKRALLSLLGRAGLLLPVYRLYEGIRAVRGWGGSSADSLPLPPARYRLMVAGTPGADWFLSSGKAAADSIRGILPVPMESLRSVLDFGCGCGRVVRWWRDLPGEVAGTDFHAGLVRWCRANLTFASFDVNDLEPPLTYETSSFDLVYGLSVLTHLPVDGQRRWLEELARVSRQWVVLSIHGNPYRARLTDEEQAAFDAGEIVVRWGVVAGTNLCTTFHPRSAFDALVAPRFELVSYEHEGAKGNPPQDLVLLRVK